MMQLTPQYDVVVEIAAYDAHTQLTLFFSTKATQTDFKIIIEEFCREHNIGCLANESCLPKTMQMSFSEHIYALEQVKAVIAQAAKSNELSFFWNS